MKKLDRFRHLQLRLQQASKQLEASLEGTHDKDEVYICGVAVVKGKALKMQSKISEILSASQLIDLEEDFIPIQLIMVSDEWREIQAEINEINS